MSLMNIIPKENKASLCDQLLQTLDVVGFGSLSKADTDALLYHLIDINKSDDSIYDNYDWIRLLRVTPSKLKSLQLTASVKYLDLEDSEMNWILAFKGMSKKKIEIEDPDKGTVRFFVGDAHVYRFIEKFVVDGGSSLDYQRNTGQVVMKYEVYLDLLIKLKEKIEINETDLFESIAKDKSYSKIQKEFDSPMQIFEDFKEKFKDKAFDEIAKTAIELVSTTVFKYAKNKLSGK